MLSTEEKERYTRHFLLDGWDEEAQEKIKNTTVFVAGAGGTGSPTITMLALIGVGCIRICDFDIFMESNKNRQFIHCLGEERVGMNKAESAALTVHSINPNVKVEYFDEKFTRYNIDDMVGDAEIIFDCVDRFKYKFVLADCARRKNIPMLFYGIMDYAYFGYIFDPTKTACFHCLFDEKKVAVVDKLSVNRGDVAVMAPTLFSAAGIMVNEAVKILIGYDKPAYNTFYIGFGKCHDLQNSRGLKSFKYWNTAYFNAEAKKAGFDFRTINKTSMFQTIHIERNPLCPYCQDGKI
ncbi:MAG: HesA/MoeB/ThiF family protein [Coprococcus sp.]|nr:HesA/MoeB/ThiF family protein [Coprococcus sp.]